ncbi:hypothetical protein HpBGD97_15010 [Helicobacter pylori]|uniref:hypothetical protein n=1 Tax=Helicobacter pylori TaxID=210 RepID=UPI0036F3DC51
MEKYHSDQEYEEIITDQLSDMQLRENLRSAMDTLRAVPYTNFRAHETEPLPVFRPPPEKKKKKQKKQTDNQQTTKNKHNTDI